jgi:dienelactone hydrolase
MLRRGTVPSGRTRHSLSAQRRSVRYGSTGDAKGEIMRRLLHLTVLLASLSLAGVLHAQRSVDAPRADGAQTPLMVYQPSSAACPPLLLLSHGAGGDEHGLRYLAQAMQNDGWRVIVMGHRESGLAAVRADIRKHGFKGGLREIVADPDAYRARFMDIEAALKWSEQQCHAPFKALAGHSMGAHTVQLEAGARNTLGLQPAGGFDAYVALSPAGPDKVFPADADRAIRAPMLMITGTRDDGLEGDYRWRMQAFDALPPGCHWLAVIDGATHMNFGGNALGASVEKTTQVLVSTWLDALRQGRCGTLPALTGVSLMHK